MKTSFALGVLGATLLTVSCSSHTLSAEGDGVSVPKAVRMATVELSGEQEPAKYSAILTPNVQVDLAFRVSGYVVELYQTRSAGDRLRPLEPGSPVPAGTVLARIRPSDYKAVVDKAHGAYEEAEAGIRAAEAQLVQAHAGLVQAELDFGRVSALWEQESITKPAYDASKARLDVAKASVDADKATIAAAQERANSAEGQMHEAQIALGDTELRAPFDGILLERRVELGTLVTAGTPAFTLADLQSVKARFNVPDFALTGFQRGQTLTLSVLAFSREIFRGRILSLSPAADPKARSFEIEVTLPNVGMKLRSGMIATVSAADAAAGQRQLQVPAAAVVHDPASNRYVVYTVEQNAGRTLAKAIPVELGPLAGNHLVVSAGLRPGQKIVVVGANLLQTGDPVREVD